MFLKEITQVNKDIKTMNSYKASVEIFLQRCENATLLLYKAQESHRPLSRTIFVQYLLLHGRVRAMGHGSVYLNVVLYGQILNLILYSVVGSP